MSSRPGKSRNFAMSCFTVGDVYASLCKRGAYAPFARIRALASATFQHHRWSVCTY